VAEAVIEGPQSKVWDEAENRLHVQKAIMATLMGSRASAKRKSVSDKREHVTLTPNGARGKGPKRRGKP
jgi:hypothetical protein